ncbi:restriction endonuclease subunit S [Atopobium deltae]|uniref:Type I restriction modification DNA specificity domain-containing protein n=1 Tax=Atopobium deltae TaxID=1393034 RepID=A0A133XTL5_9ACTN|nr:restriction endonuclease subunit S [Atopobium deltae]KXB34284.1 hypothetical protein HMPREF3192_00942 [Atopobium deltae]
MERLSEKEWSTGIIGDVFSVSGTTTTHPSKLIANGSTPRITCASVNNGLDSCYRNEPTEKGGVLTVDSATVGTVLFQPSDFIATDHVEKISGNKSFGEAEGLFIKTCIDISVAGKYQYGYKFSQNRVKRQKLMLPIDDKGNPDYAYMTLYSTEVRGGMLMRYKNFIAGQLSQLEYKEIPALNEKEWGHFLIPDVFSGIQRGKRLKNADHVPGVIPYVSSTANNNGVDDYVKATAGTRSFSDCISLANSGSVGTAFYEPFEFVASDHVTSLKREGTSKFVYLFLVTTIERQGSNFNFNREINDARIKKMQVMLPVTDAGKPDYNYMEQYAKNMMLRKYEQYLAFIDRQSAGEEVTL